jgi:small-conductance mechanosensitive channel
MTDGHDHEQAGETGPPGLGRNEGWARRHARVDDAARHQGIVAAVCGAGAVVAMAVSSTLGDVHGPSTHQKLVAFIGAGVFIVLAVLAVRAAAASLTAVVTANAGAPSGGAVSVFVSLVGYVIVLFVGLGLLGVPLEHLLLGGVLTSVIVGIAAQQALGNVFAGIVLLLTRPFSLGDRIRVRSGALGGMLEGVVTSMSLVYVTVATDEGVVNLPNSSLLAAGVGPAPGGPPHARHVGGAGT